MRLLSFAAAHAGQLGPKDEIYDHLWPEQQDLTGEERPYERQIADHKQRLIARLHALGLLKQELQRLILTQSGKGYCLRIFGLFSK